FTTVNVPRDATGVPVFAVEYTPTAVILHTSLVVNSTLDTMDPADNLTTLREAIMQANASPDRDFIFFNIPTGDPGYNGTTWTIAPASALPTVSESAVIDATTQPTYAGAPLVQLDGAAIPDADVASGLTFTAGN